MAEATWSRPPATQPPVTITLKLDLAEAKALQGVIDGDGDVCDLRCENVAVYDVITALDKALWVAPLD